MIEYNALRTVSKALSAETQNTSAAPNRASQHSQHCPEKVLSSRNSKDPNEYLRSTQQCFTLYRPGLCKVDLLWMHSFPNISETIHYFQNFLLINIEV